MARIAVVGAGIAGLSAARRLVSLGHEVVVLEATDQVGGKLRGADIAGRMVDVGAESLLWRRPEARALLGELGITATHPASLPAAVWSRGALHRLPKGTLMGIPARARDAAGLLTAEEIARAEAERTVTIHGDMALGEVISAALGDAVVDRLVEPLLGGVYAGHARLLSVQACLPQVKDAAAEGISLSSAAERASLAARDPTSEPVFATVPGGLWNLPEILAAGLRDAGAIVHTGAVVRELHRTHSGWSLTAGETRDHTIFHADALVLATPAPATARLLCSYAPEASAGLAEIEYASMVIITYAFSREHVPASMHEGSGFLVPPVDRREIKAATFSTAKWPWLAQGSPDVVYARVSMGRHREERALQRSDRELAQAGLRDLGEALNGNLPQPLDQHVQRWGGGLPQYQVGHVARLGQIRRGLATVGGIEVAGAAYDGVGVPACIGSGVRAAEALDTQVRSS